jgi:RecJ-like exonuclease
MNKMCKCYYCDGKGYINNTYKTSFKKCPVCKGTKLIKEEKCNNTSTVDEALDYLFGDIIND